MYLDGDALLPDGAAPMRERRKLGYAGVVVVSALLDRKGALGGAPQIFCKGVFDGDDLAGLAEDIVVAIGDLPGSKRRDDDAVEIAIRRAARAFFDDVWGKRPFIETHIHRAGS